MPDKEMIKIDGRKYRRFIRWPEEITDGTLRCICCGQIDEEPWHDWDTCMKFRASPAAPATVDLTPR